MALNLPWLDKVHEAAIDPAYPVIDPHHHLWPMRPVRGYEYLEDALHRDFTAGHKVIASVYIQCTSMYRQDGPEHLKPVGETEWVNAIAEKFAQDHPNGPALAAGIVGHCDFTGDRVDEVLEAHLAAAPKRFRGIRQSCPWTDDADVAKTVALGPKDLLLDPAFRRGFAQLAKYGLSFDGWMFHLQMPALADLARAFPDIPIVLDHLGAPIGKGSFASRRDEVLKDWRKSIAELAACPNVHMKLGGAVMPVFGYEFDSRALPPSSDDLIKASGHFYHEAIDAFSPARCMFESNFPVDKEQCAYVPLWNSFKKMAARYSEAERADLFRNTAARFYRLDEQRQANGR